MLSAAISTVHMGCAPRRRMNPIRKLVKNVFSVRRKLEVQYLRGFSLSVLIAFVLINTLNVIQACII